MREAVLGFALAKLLVLGFAALAWPVQQDRPLGGPLGALEIWNRWDARHYLHIAEHGYQIEGDPANFIVFLPLYPWLVRLVAWPLGNHLAAAFLVSTAASLVAAWALARLALLDAGEEQARRTGWALAAFPTAYFLHIGYTESLFLALVLGAFLAARGGRWLAAAPLAAAAGLTRTTALALVPALALEAFAEWRRTRRLRPGFLAVLAPAVGFAGYLLVNYVVTGSPFTFLRVQRENWYKSPAPPWQGLAALLRNFERGPSDAVLLGAAELGFALLGLGAIGWAAVRLRPSCAAWMAGNWLLFMGTSWVMSVPRYTLALFPLFDLLGRCGARRPLGLALFAAGWLLQALLVLRFSQGLWAF